MINYFLGLHRGLKLPNPDQPAAEKQDLMLAARRCSHEHEEVGWTGTPASECWMCDRPCTPDHSTAT